MVAAVLSKYGSSSAKILNVYNRNGEKLFTVDIVSAVKSVSCDNQRVSVLTDSELICFDMKGNEVSRHSVESDGIRCFLTVLIRMYILRLRFPHIVQTAIPRMTRQQSMMIVNILLICLLGCCMVV